MAFLNFLGDLAGGGDPSSLMMPGAGGAALQLPQGHRIDPALEQGLPTGAAPQHHGLLGGNWLGKLAGTIGDALLVANGLPAQYGPRMRQKKVGAALANYLGNTDAGLAEIFQEDPATGIALYKIQHPTNEVPAAMKEWQAYQQMNPETQNRFRQFRQSMSPQFMSPITLPENATIQYPGGGSDGGASLPSVTDQASYDAVPPGAHYVTPDGHIRIKGGASPSNGSATFP